MKNDSVQGLSLSPGSMITFEYTDSQGKMKQAAGVVKNTANDQLLLLLNEPDSTTSLPLGKELFLTIPPGADASPESHRYICYVIGEDEGRFSLLTVTPPLERPKQSTGQSFYCRVKLPLSYFINKIEFSGEVINLSAIRFFAVAGYNPELRPGMMLNFQLALPSKIYPNLVGEILLAHKLSNNQMAIVVNFLNTRPDLQSAIVKYLFQRQHELAQSKQPLVIEPKKSTRVASLSQSSIGGQELRRQFISALPEEGPVPEDQSSGIARIEPERIPVFKSNGKSELFPGRQSVRLAGFWIRGAAFLLDLLILTVIGALTTLLFAVIVMLVSHASLIGDTWSRILNPTGSFLTGFSIIIGFALYWSYFTALESSQRQATFGKRWLKIIVISGQGKPLSLGTAGKRALLRLFSIAILFIGFIMVGFSSKKQALHDLLTKTFVIKEE
ncbi:MAG: RDD family protein [Firmicutes bacterium]|nr:RDD family protein [Bacillota bacterium]